MARLQEFLRQLNDWSAIVDDPISQSSLYLDDFLCIAKFSCGVAPIRVETGQCERLPLGEHMCHLCIGDIENKLHVLSSCLMCNDLRDQMYIKAKEK